MHNPPMQPRTLHQQKSGFQQPGFFKKRWLLLKRITLIFSLYGSSLCLATPPEITEIQCNLPGCQLRCLDKNGAWKSLGEAASLTMSLYESGITKYVLEKGVDGFSTLIVGTHTPVCVVSNQRG